MQERQKIASGAKWEDIVGYSRLVRVGPRIYITGTTATGESGNLVGLNDGYAQAVQCIRNIERALVQAGATLANVVRTRMYVTDIAQWEKVAAIHGEVFAQVRPATTIVEVAKLIDDEALIEIEVDAVVG